MTYPIAAFILIAIFIVCVLYMIVTRKSRKQINTILYPGLFFVAAWAIIYYLLLK